MAVTRAKITTRTTPSLTPAFACGHEEPYTDLLRRCFFAEPLFRGSSPDIAHLGNIRGTVKLDIPGVNLAAASEYYWIEAYASTRDRDAACGLTANRDVKYIALASNDIPRTDLDRISCGYPIGHPRFEEVFELTFATTLRNLANVVSSVDGRMAQAAEFSIGRIHYAITPLPDRGRRFRFRIDGLSLFEKHEQDLLDRTAEYLERRLIAETSKNSTLH
jgi:hypothetical protein